MKISLVALTAAVLLWSCGSIARKTESDAGLSQVDGSLQSADATAPTCSDGMQNGSEEGPDCGGSCDACVECQNPTDCPSGLCEAGVCRSSLLTDCRDVAPDNATSVPEQVTTEWNEEKGWSEPAACSWTCNANYDRVDEACIDERQVECTDAAPDNATSLIESVTITYSDAQGWSAAPTCSWRCDADFDEVNGACIDEQSVPCNDQPPANGSSIPEMVTIVYTDDTGWSTPDRCDFSCNSDYCRVGGQCEFAYDEFRFTAGTSNSWFGGDDRVVGQSRNVGSGQSVRIPADVSLGRFAFRFTGPFTSAANGGPGVPVTLQLDLRNANGGVLASAQRDVPSGFAGGWIWWDLAADLSADEEYIFTAFVVDGFSLGVNSFIRGDQSGGYAGGSRLGKSGGDDLSDWSGWLSGGSDGWDNHFWLRSAPACPQP